MEISEATVQDVGEIVNLLKKSLGESLMPKSEAYWNWKHVQNPFGTSPVLICREGNELIGVRAFMRWEWRHNNEVYRSLRAVDTATHPDHQGKGIFKKLTLALVDQCSRAGDHFVFNTPNGQSMPGYLKMGWEMAGKLPVDITIHRPFSMVRRTIAKFSNRSLEDNDISHYLQHSGLERLIRSQKATASTVTNSSVAYLKWRYRDVPVASYIAVGEEQGNNLNGLVLGRIKEGRFGRELRITDHFSIDEGVSAELIKKLSEKRKEWKIDYTTLAGTNLTNLKKMNRFLTFRSSIGPIVTIRKLSMKELEPLKNFNQWSPTLGDLELF